MSSDHDEEWLSRYCDGELDEAERTAFERRLDADPALAKRLARWRDNDRQVAQAFGADLAAPLPDAVLALLGNRPSAEIIDLAAARAHRQPAPVPPMLLRRVLPAAAVAAGIALVVLVVKPGRMPAGHGPDAVELALSTVPSGQSAVAGGARLAPTLSFIAGDGRWCREYEERHGGETRTDIACRSGTGWHVEGSARGAAGETPGSGYAAAAGRDPAGLDPVYARLRAGDPLSAAEEQRLIKTGRL